MENHTKAHRIESTVDSGGVKLICTAIIETDGVQYQGVAEVRGIDPERALDLAHREALRMARETTQEVMQEHSEVKDE